MVVLNICSLNDAATAQDDMYASQTQSKEWLSRLSKKE